MLTCSTNEPISYCWFLISYFSVSNHGNSSGNSSQKHHKQRNCLNATNSSCPSDTTNSALNVNDSENDLLVASNGHCSKSMSSTNAVCPLSSIQSTSSNVINKSCIHGNNNNCNCNNGGNNISTNSTISNHNLIKSPSTVTADDRGNDDDQNSYSGYNSGDEHIGQKYDLTPEEWVDRDREFVKMMSERGFVVEEIGEDGACLFRSISLQIFGDQDMHEIIRQQTMDYIVSGRLFSINSHHKLIIYSFYSQKIANISHNLLPKILKAMCHASEIITFTAITLKFRPFPKFTIVPSNSIHIIQVRYFWFPFWVENEYSKMSFFLLVLMMLHINNRTSQYFRSRSNANRHRSIAFIISTWITL